MKLEDVIFEMTGEMYNEVFALKDEAMDYNSTDAFDIILDKILTLEADISKTIKAAEAKKRGRG